MKDTKDRILHTAFILFLLNNYEKVTINDIENELKISRGSIFYHIKNKEDLFKKVIDKFILDVQNVNNKLSCDETLSLKDFINDYISKVQCVMKTLGEGVHSENPHRAYFSLFFQACHYYANFDKLVTSVFQEEHKKWQRIVKNAIKNKEIRSDLDYEMVADHFRFIYSGLSFENSLNNGLDTTHLLKLFNYYYELIKQ